VQLLHQPQQAPDEALQHLFSALNETRTTYPGTRLRLVCEFVSD